MQDLMKYIDNKLTPKINKLSELGKRAKLYTKEKRDHDTIAQIHLDMARICHELRPVEVVVKALYPKLSELYDNLVALYDNQIGNKND